MFRKGSIMDLRISSALSSTKNESGQRDPGMYQTQKGNQWYFGMKAHIGTDADSGLVHSLTGTSANVADITETERLLHGEESDVFAGAGYTGVAKRDELKDKNVTWHVAEKRGKLKKMTEGPRKNLVTQFERAKAQIRAKV
jgi:IS5 family transposase